MQSLYLNEVYEIIFNSYQRKKEALPYIDMTVGFSSIFRQGDLNCFVADICLDFRESLGIPSPTAFLITMYSKMRDRHYLGYITESINFGDNRTQAKICMMSNRGEFTPGEKIQFKLIKHILLEVHTLTAIKSLRGSPLRKQIVDPPTEINVFNFRADGELKTGDECLSLTQVEIIKTICTKMVEEERDKTPSISVLEGPPATGKTRVAANIILQAILGEKTINNPRVLVCAPSSAAADTITNKLDELIKPNMKLKLVRADYRDRVSKSLRHFYPDVQAREELAGDIKSAVDLVSKGVPIQQKRKDILAHIDRIKLSKNADNDELDKMKRALERIEFDIYRQKNRGMKNMGKEGVVRGKIETILTTANIVVTTSDYCGVLFDTTKNLPNGNNFSICVFDDANVASEIFVLIPLMFKVRHLVLVGDAELTPPKMKSAVANKNLLHQSLFHRIRTGISSNTFGSRNATYKLDCQYRMPEEILHFIKGYFYRNSRVSNSNLIAKRMEDFEYQPYVLMPLPNDALIFLGNLLRKILCDIYSICVLVADEKQGLEVIKRYIQ